MKENEVDPVLDSTGEGQDGDGIEKNELVDASAEQSDRISNLEAELTAAKDKNLRLMAEFENVKKRVAKERVEILKMASADVLTAILPVIDDLERALKSIKDSDAAAREGVQLIYNKIKSIVESKDLKAMDSVGKDFDPDIHDAIANVPAPSEDMKGKVVEEIEKGYYLNDKVIRHAKVIVGN